MATINQIKNGKDITDLIFTNEMNTLIIAVRRTS